MSLRDCGVQAKSLPLATAGYKLNRGRCATAGHTLSRCRCATAGYKLSRGRCATAEYKLIRCRCATAGYKLSRCRCAAAGYTRRVRRPWQHCAAMHPHKTLKRQDRCFQKRSSIHSQRNTIMTPTRHNKNRWVSQEVSSEDPPEVPSEVSSEIPSKLAGSPFHYHKFGKNWVATCPWDAVIANSTWGTGAHGELFQGWRTHVSTQLGSRGAPPDQATWSWRLGKGCRDPA